MRGCVVGCRAGCRRVSGRVSSGVPPHNNLSVVLRIPIRHQRSLAVQEGRNPRPSPPAVRPCRGVVPRPLPHTLSLWLQEGDQQNIERIYTSLDAVIVQ